MVQRSLWELPNGYKLLLSVPEGSDAQSTVNFSHVNGHKINRSLHASTVKLPNLIYCLLTDLESPDTLHCRGLMWKQNNMPALNMALKFQHRRTNK